MLKRTVHKLLSRLRSLTPSHGSSLPASSDQELGHLLQQIETLLPPSQIEPGSAEGRRAFEVWFNVMSLADRRINQYCMSYYDGRHPKHVMWRAHNAFIVENVLPGDRVLDIGCGASYYTQELAEIAESVTGIDVNPERVAASQAMNQKPNVTYRVMDATRDIPEDAFDVAVCSHVIEHLDDPVAFLARVAERVPRLIVKVPLVDSDWRKLVKKDVGLFWMDDRDHRREYTEALLSDQLADAGWEVDTLIRGFDLRATARSKGLAA